MFCGDAATVMDAACSTVVPHIDISRGNALCPSSPMGFFSSLSIRDAAFCPFALTLCKDLIRRLSWFLSFSCLSRHGWYIPPGNHSEEGSMSNKQPLSCPRCGDLPNVFGGHKDAAASGDRYFALTLPAVIDCPCGNKLKAPAGLYLFKDGKLLRQKK